MKKGIKWFGLAVSLVFLIVGIIVLIKTSGLEAVHIQQDFVKQQIDGKLPLAVGVKGGKLTIEKADVYFLDGVMKADVEAQYHFQGEIKGFQFPEKKFDVDATIFLDAPILDGREVYVVPQNVTVNKIAIDGKTFNKDRVKEIFTLTQDKVFTSETSKKVTDKISSWANRFGVKEEVDKATDALFEWTTANQAVIIAQVHDGAQELLSKAAHDILSDMPVYTLPDDTKVWVLTSFLDEFEIKPEVLIVHLSVFSGLKALFWFLFPFLLVISFIWALVKHPKQTMAVLEGVVEVAEVTADVAGGIADL